MEELIKRLQDTVGLSQEDATKSVAALIEFVKEKLPAGLGDQLVGMMKNGFDLNSMFGAPAQDNDDPMAKLRKLGN